MKLKIRDGCIVNLEKYFKNDNYINFRIDYLSWGLGFDFYIGDAKRYFRMCLLCSHFELWF